MARNPRFAPSHYALHITQRGYRQPVFFTDERPMRRSLWGIDREFRTQPDACHAAMGGSSLGGLVAHRLPIPVNSIW